MNNDTEQRSDVTALQGKIAGAKIYLLGWVNTRKEEHILTLNYNTEG